MIILIKECIRKTETIRVGMVVFIFHFSFYKHNLHCMTVNARCRHRISRKNIYTFLVKYIDINKDKNYRIIREFLLFVLANKYLLFVLANLYCRLKFTARRLFSKSQISADHWLYFTVKMTEDLF